MIFKGIPKEVRRAAAVGQKLISRCRLPGRAAGPEWFFTRPAVMKNRIDRASAAVAECSSAVLPPLIRLVRWPGCSSGPRLQPQVGLHAPRLEVDRIGHHRLLNRLGGRIFPHPGEDARVAPPRPSGVKAGSAGPIPWQSPQAVIPQPPDRSVADEPLAALGRRPWPWLRRSRRAGAS